MQILEPAAALWSAGGDGRPDAFAPTPSAFAARPLRNEPFDHHEANGLLGEIVVRLDPRRRNEPEIVRPVLPEALGHSLGLGARRGAFAYGDQLFPRLFQGPLEPRRGHRLPPVDP